MEITMEQPTGIADLENFGAVEPLDWDNYEDATQGGSGKKTLPGGAVYTLRVPDQITFKDVDKTYKLSTDPSFKPALPLVAKFETMKILNVDTNLFRDEIRYVSISSKRFTSKGTDGKAQNASQTGDYLRRTGSAARPGVDPAEWVAAIEATAGSTVEAYCDWEAYDKVTKKTLRGMRNFPKDANGEYQPFVDVPDGNDEAGNPQTRRVWGNLKVTIRGFSLTESK
jgi:hypothetical protein